MVDGLAGGSNRTRVMELTSFFDAIVDDAEKILLAGGNRGQTTFLQRSATLLFKKMRMVVLRMVV